MCLVSAVMQAKWSRTGKLSCFDQFGAEIPLWIG